MVQYAQHVGHQEIAGREPAFEVVLLSKSIGQLAQTRPEECLDLRASCFRPLFLGMEEVDAAEFLDDRLDRVQRRVGPRNRAGSTGKVIIGAALGQTAAGRATLITAA